MSSKKRISPPAPPHDDRRDHLAQHLTRRVAHHAPERHDTGLGTAAGNPCLRHLDIEREIVSRPKRRQPAQFVDTGRAQRRGAADIAVEHHPHHDRAKMPAGSREAVEHRARRCLFVEVHRLRIELGGKSEDLLARDAARSECAEMAGRKIFKRQRHDGDWCEGGPIVAVICGNLNLPTRMARALRANIALRCSSLNLARGSIWS
jgi:hypothetical protein